MRKNWRTWDVGVGVGVGIIVGIGIDALNLIDSAVKNFFKIINI